MSVYAVTSSWTATSVSYSQAVAFTGTEFYNPDNLYLYTDVDITSLVQGWINNPSTDYGLSLRSDAESTNLSAKYFDGMYGVSLPQLIITVPEPGAFCLLASGLLTGSFYFFGKRNESKCRLMKTIACLALVFGVLPLSATRAEGQPLKGLLYNEDATNLIFHCDIAERKAGGDHRPVRRRGGRSRPQECSFLI